MTKPKKFVSIEECQTNRVPYLKWHGDAERRTKKGEVQYFCVVCQRYKWSDELCTKAEIGQENFFDAIRNDPDMTPEDKQYWLNQEPKQKGGESNEGDLPFQSERESRG